MTNVGRLLGCASLSLLLWGATPVSAQHAHGGGPPVLVLTSPKDDSVLASMPPVVALAFRSDVRLLKLRLLSAARHNIDIDFYYDPTRVGSNIVWNLPTLPRSSYYIVAWTVADENDQMLEGEIRFAIGAHALQPSEFIKRYGLYVDHEDSPSPR